MLLLGADRASLWLRERGELDSGKFLHFGFHLTLVLLTSPYPQHWLHSWRVGAWLAKELGRGGGEKSS